MTLKRTVLRRLLVWALAGVLPYVGLMAAVVVNALVESTIDESGSAGITLDIPDLLGGAIWAAFYLLVPPVFAAGLLGGIDIGLLVILRRAKFNHWIRAAIPGVVVGLVAMGLFSTYVFLTMFNLCGTGHYYAWAAAGATAVAVAVYASHVHHYRSSPVAERASA